jgi:hypothetical protein
MSISLGHDLTLMTQQPLDLIQISAPLHQGRGKAMPKVVKPEILDPCLFQCLLK